MTTMLLTGSELDLLDIETTIARVLRSATELDASVHAAVGQFEIILATVCRRLPKDYQCRYWSLDDFDCQLMDRAGDVIHLSGVAYWLSGGDGCDRFRLAVSLDTAPLLYSFKFLNGQTAKQLLYIGKTPEGWVVNHEAGAKVHP